MHGFKGHPISKWTYKTESAPKDRSYYYVDSDKRLAKIPHLSSVTPHFKKNKDHKYIYWSRYLILITLSIARVLIYEYNINIRYFLGALINKSIVYNIIFDFLKSLKAKRRL